VAHGERDRAGADESAMTKERSMKKQPLKDRNADLEREAFMFRKLANEKGYVTVMEALENVVERS
jgi:hypothetical protein